MDAGQVTLNSTMAMALQQLQSISEMQVEILKNMAQSQQQMAEMLHSAGIGQNVDIRA